MDLMFNQSGQAFDVFKLLIAAVVAVVILTLLLSIINQIGIFGQSDPASKAGTLIRDLSTKKATYDKTESVSFSSGKGLTNKGVAEATRGNLQPDEVCILPGDFKDSFGSVGDSGKQWVGTLGVTITYKGSSAQKASIGGICDTDTDMSNDNSYFETYTGGEIDGTEASQCACLQSTKGTTCCIVVIKR